VSDEFERAVQDIAMRTAGNGGPTTRDLLAALVAANNDSESRHEAITAAFTRHISDEEIALERITSHLESESGHIAKMVRSTMKDHADHMDTPMMLRIEALAASHEQMQAVVDDRGARIEQAKKEVIAEILREQRPRRKSDPDGEDHVNDRAIVVAERKFTREQIVTAVILFLVAVLASNLIGALVERITK